MAENKIKSDYLLSRINEMFKIVDISNKIVSAKNEEIAKQIHEVQDFDRVPIEDNDGNIKEYYDSNKNKTVQITPADLISESTGILETLSNLYPNKFYFVLTGNKITHIVHYSDLNNPIVLPGIYTLIAYCEIKIREYARENNTYGKTDNDIERFLTYINTKNSIKINIARAKKQLKTKIDNKIETNLLDELYLDDELIMFRELISMLNDERSNEFKKCVDLSDTTITSYNKLRNDIMHSNYQMIEKQSHDVEELGKFIKACQWIISYIENISN